MPEHRAPQILGALVDIFVERALVDAFLALVLDQVAEGLGDRALILVADLESAEEDHAALFVSGASVLCLAAPQQRLEVYSLFSADPRGEVDGVQLGGGKVHG